MGLGNHLFHARKKKGLSLDELVEFDIDIKEMNDWCFLHGKKCLHVFDERGGTNHGLELKAYDVEMKNTQEEIEIYLLTKQYYMLYSMN